MTGPGEMCANGHPRTPETIYMTRRGRRCLICKRNALNRRDRRKWDAAHAGHDVQRYPSGRRRCRTCTPARAREWEVDDAAVERAVAGDPPDGLNPAERAAAVLRLRRHGLSAQQVADLVGCSPRTVVRIYARNGLTQPRARKAAS